MPAIVVSGASRGLGAALTRRAIDLGCDVLAIARDLSGLWAAKDAGGQLTLVECDLSRPERVPRQAMAAMLRDATEVVLINNAATVHPIGAVGRLGASSLSLAAATNLGAIMTVTDAFLAALSVDDGPQLTLSPKLKSVRLVLISTSAARRPKPGAAAYCATKAGAEMFFEVLRQELAADPRCRVDVVDPGAMDTDMHASLRDATGVYFPDQARMRAVAASGGLADPQDVAGRILEGVLTD